MCVKEFYGYVCGHCSVPHLRKCPIASADVNYPACEHPAERPIFTDENCHPCSRVVWNKGVLEREEHHRLQHKNGECDCEVIFDNEERERRAREKLSRVQAERGGDEHRGGVYSGRGGRGGRGEYGESRGGHVGSGYDNNGFGNSRVGYLEGGYKHVSRGYRESGGLSEYGRKGFRARQMDQFQSPAYQYCASSSEASSFRYDWAPEAKSNAHQYHGYNNDENAIQGVDQSLGPAAYVHPTGLMMGQRGAGMKWYDVEPSMPPLLELSGGIVLPPLPPPFSGFDSPAYQVPLIPSSNSQAYQALQVPVFAYPTYQTPVTGPGLVYQKAMSEPSTSFESPVKSIRTTKRQSSHYSSGIALGRPASDYQQNSASRSDSENASTSTMRTAKQNWNDDYTISPWHQRQKSLAVACSDPGEEGSSA